MLLGEGESSQSTPSPRRIPDRGPGQAPGSSGAFRRIESRVSRDWTPASAGMTEVMVRSFHRS